MTNEPNTAAIGVAWSETLKSQDFKGIIISGGDKWAFVQGYQKGYEAAKAAESADTTRDALVKALRHYAEPGHWVCPECISRTPHSVCPQRFWVKTTNGYDIAREALKAIDAEEGKGNGISNKEK